VIIIITPLLLNFNLKFFWSCHCLVKGRIEVFFSKLNVMV